MMELVTKSLAFDTFSTEVVGVDLEDQDIFVSVLHMTFQLLKKKKSKMRFASLCSRKGTRILTMHIISCTFYV